MTLISTILPYIQIFLSIAIVVLILLQRSEAGLGGAFGGGDNLGSQAPTRRGLEKTLFNLTVIIAILFVLSAFLNLLIS